MVEKTKPLVDKAGDVAGSLLDKAKEKLATDKTDGGATTDAGERRTPSPRGEGSQQMVSAYILVQTEVGKASQVTDQIKALGGVVNADGVTGPYDVIARVEADDLDGLAKKIVMPMQEIEGITRTLTCPVLSL